MYNPYLPHPSGPSGPSYCREGPSRPHPHSSNPQGTGGAGDVLKKDEQPPKKGLSGLLKTLKLEELDTGDVLLLLILLFLFLDDREENLEVLITLGLMLVL